MQLDISLYRLSTNAQLRSIPIFQYLLWLLYRTQYWQKPSRYIGAIRKAKCFQCVVTYCTQSTVRQLYAGISSTNKKFRTKVRSTTAFSWPRRKKIQLQYSMFHTGPCLGQFTDREPGSLRHSSVIIRETVSGNRCVECNMAFRSSRTLYGYRSTRKQGLKEQFLLFLRYTWQKIDIE